MNLHPKDPNCHFECADWRLVLHYMDFACQHDLLQVNDSLRELRSVVNEQ